MLADKFMNTSVKRRQVRRAELDQSSAQYWPTRDREGPEASLVWFQHAQVGTLPGTAVSLPCSDLCDNC